jgi:hypothetical protein
MFAVVTAALLRRILSDKQPVLQLDGLTETKLRLLLERLEPQANALLLHALNRRVDSVAERGAKKNAYLKRMRELREAAAAGMQ